MGRGEGHVGGKRGEDQVLTVRTRGMSVPLKLRDLG